MKLLIIDYSNLLIRHALNPYNRESSEDLGGVSGSLRQTINLFREIKPSHLLLAKDSDRNSLLRKEISPGYKANRKNTHEVDISEQFRVSDKAIELLQLPNLSVERYEADDVIASAVSEFPGEALVVTGDKDLLALCSDRVIVRLLRPGGFIDCSAEQCSNIFGIPPSLITDYKALAGDKSDGIPGIPGIGDKSAVKLLQAHGSFHNIENMIKQGEVLDVSSRINNLASENIEEGVMSYNLAELVYDIDLPDYKNWVYHSPPTDAQIGEDVEKLNLNYLRRILEGYVDDSYDDFVSAFNGSS